MESKTGKLTCEIIAVFTSAIMLLINVNVFSTLNLIDGLDVMTKVYVIFKLIAEIMGILFTLLNVAVLADRRDVRGLGYLTVILNFCFACVIFCLAMCIYDGQISTSAFPSISIMDMLCRSAFPYIDLMGMLYGIAILIGYAACNKSYPSEAAQRIKQNEDYAARLEKEYDEQILPPVQPQPAHKTITTEALAKELKSYKTLLDEGAITQEEYDKIKASYLADFQQK